MITIEEQLKDLLPEEQTEVIHFIEFIKYKKKKEKSPQKKMSFSWAGALKHVKGYTAVELQHKANELRIK